MSGIEVDGIRLEEKDEVIVKLDGKNYRFPRKIEGAQIQIASNINPAKYALVQDRPFNPPSLVTTYSASSAIFMNQMFNGQGDFFSLHELVFASGLKGMDARKFLPHLYNVNEALHERGVLYDASGNLIEGDNLRAYAHKLNHDSWAYVNGHFQKSEKGREGFRGLDLLTITSYENGKAVFSRTPLEPCLENDCFADITPESLNSQGFPTKRAPTNKYEEGKTAHFYFPRDYAVVRFLADSVSAFFYCHESSGNPGNPLGVFASVDVKRGR